MEKLTDRERRIPLLVLGTLPTTMPGAVPFLSVEMARAGVAQLNSFYVLVALPAPEAAVSALLTDVPPDQILVLAEPGLTLPNEDMALVEILPRECPEDFRPRLSARLEQQRHKKLSAALREAAAPSAISLDAARLAHALACGYGLPPRAHGQAIRAALFGSPSNSPWAGDPAPDILIPAVAIALASELYRGGSARELVRVRSATLSYRARTELFHQLESCLAFLLGGRNVA